jgi:hypothetical protein
MQYSELGKEESSISDFELISSNEDGHVESAYEYVNSCDLCENEIFEDSDDDCSYEEVDLLNLRISDSSESESSRLFQRISPILRNLSPLNIESNFNDDIIITYPSHIHIMITNAHFFSSGMGLQARFQNFKKK